MPGVAVTNEFLLSSATIMVGPMADLFKLNVANHSLGLCKNVNFKTEFGQVVLGQGVMNTPVATVKNSAKATITAEIYEYTGKNLAYGLGLDGTSVVSTAVAPLALSATHTGDDTTPIVAVTCTAATDVHASFPSGAWIMIQERSGEYDHVHVAQLASVSSYGTGVLTLTLTLTAATGLKTGNTFTTAAQVWVMSKLSVGSQQATPYLAMKIVGLLPNGQKALPLYFPKVQITKGAEIVFDTQNFGKMPYEFSPLVLTSSESTSAIRTLFGSDLALAFKDSGD